MSILLALAVVLHICNPTSW